MLRKLYLVPVLALFLLPGVAKAQFEQGNWELSLAGSGFNDQDWTTGSVSIQGSLGYFTTKELELGVRQSYTWGDGGSAWNGDTRVFADYHFDLDRWQPFVGANVGYVYGDGVSDSWIAGPEVGVKYFVNSTTFIGVSAAYEFNLQEGLEDGAFFYTLGLGFKW
ncbi:MAG TPA: hypothetical protein VER17_13560 [Tepidisphaeraceae bacterium]|nr:hypothetical protein [Tepidisphaeraceae bacterium]